MEEGVGQIHSVAKFKVETSTTRKNKMTVNYNSVPSEATNKKSKKNHK
jgi:hypothetical protein